MMCGLGGMGLGGMGTGLMSTGLIVAFVVVKVLLLALFIYVLYRIISKRKVNNNFAIETLKMKFVNGEISEEEYLSKVEFLKNSKNKKD